MKGPPGLAAASDCGLADGWGFAAAPAAGLDAGEAAGDPPTAAAAAGGLGATVATGALVGAGADGAQPPRRTISAMLLRQAHCRSDFGTSNSLAIVCSR